MVRDCMGGAARRYTPQLRRADMGVLLELPGAGAGAGVEWLAAAWNGTEATGVRSHATARGWRGDMVSGEGPHITYWAWNEGWSSGCWPCWASAGYGAYTDPGQENGYSC
jgi:hypothetical protein